MLAAFANCFKIPELRQRIYFTLALIVIIRIGAQIPVPGINPAVLGHFFDNYVNNQAQGGLLALVNIFSGGALANCAIFALGIMPYISASIMMQLMTAVVPSVAKMAREEGGREKITQYTRVLTIILCVFQGYLFATSFENPESIPLLSGISQSVEAVGSDLVPEKGWMFRFICVLTLTSGTMLMMWLGEQITDKGLGNGVSLVITVGIIAQLPAALVQGYSVLNPVDPSQAMSPLLLVLLLAFLFIVVAGTIAVTQAQRKVPIQQAKQVRGNKVFGGGSSNLPLKVNYAGVMPIIFAQSLLLFPAMLGSMMGEWGQWFANLFNPNTNTGAWTYYIIYASMIFFFSYFWVATMFNPTEIADNLQKNNSYIPGQRPGKPTADFLDYTMTRLTFAGSMFLTVLAVLPTLISQNLGVPIITAQFFGGTSLLIIVGVMLDTMRQAETFLLQRHYDGFLKKGRIRGRSAKYSAGTGQQPEGVGVVLLYFTVGLLVLIGIVIAAISGVVSA